MLNSEKQINRRRELVIVPLSDAQLLFVKNAGDFPASEVDKVLLNIASTTKIDHLSDKECSQSWSILEKRAREIKRTQRRIEKELRKIRKQMEEQSRKESSPKKKLR